MGNCRSNGHSISTAAMISSLNLGFSILLVAYRHPVKLNQPRLGNGSRVINRQPDRCLIRVRPFHPMPLVRREYFTNDPAVISTGSWPSNRNRAVPLINNTHSFVSWSYQKLSGEAWPCETIRSIRIAGVVSSAWLISCDGSEGRAARRFGGFMDIAQFWVTGPAHRRPCVGSGQSILRPVYDGYGAHLQVTPEHLANAVAGLAKPIGGHSTVSGRVSARMGRNRPKTPEAKIMSSPGHWLYIQALRPRTRTHFSCQYFGWWWRCRQNDQPWRGAIHRVCMSASKSCPASSSTAAFFTVAAAAWRRGGGGGATVERRRRRGGSG